MPATGPPPKAPNKRARRNKDVLPLRVVHAEPSGQPELPEPPEGEWPAPTRRWWQMWAESPLAKDFTANDWSELMDTALLHAAYWSGELRFGSELRQRVANFGATPADRAKLRITFAAADEAEEKRGKPVSSARSRRGPLTAM